ncbi:MAG: MBL fold metallo-hydrolase [Pseudolabrys sp.]|nr:MBL fold metallo-hydrolase [Pseudolabrys sp.]
MNLTIIGCGDAFGSGGRYNTCFMLETAKATLLVDCGASTMTALNAQKIDTNRIDAVVLSHLHGDHFGGLPFLLLHAQFLAKREKPMTIAGPPGTRERVDTLLEACFPKSKTGIKWRFVWDVVEIPVGVTTDILGHSVLSAEVVHQSGAPSTALRVSDGAKLFAYSGDTEWTDALIGVARDADLFICECYAYAGSKMTGHMSWEILKPRLGELRARRTMLTHMNDTMLAQVGEARAAGVLVAEDGLRLSL